MTVKTEIIAGKKRIIFKRTVSGTDKTKEAVLKVMGPGWEYEDEKGA